MNTLIQARIDIASKKQAENIFAQMGITLNEGIRMFIRQTIHDKGMPFRPQLGETPCSDTKMALAELNAGKNIKKFSSVDDLMKDLLTEKK